MTTTAKLPTTSDDIYVLESGVNPMNRAAGLLLLANAFLWAFLFFRWLTFSTFDWRPYPAELALAQWPPIFAYLIYGTLLISNILIGVSLIRQWSWSRGAGLIISLLTLAGGVAYFISTREFYGAAIIIGLSGFSLILLFHNAAWSLSFPAAFWLGIFFLAPMAIVMFVSLGERSLRGTISYPPFSFSNIGLYFDDYARFFSKINEQYIYLRIFWRSVVLATLNTVICLIFGYPFAYWIARQPVRYRNILVFLVMIPFWTNFLVRTYAWMLILRDSGVINNFWTITLHQQAAQLADKWTLFSWLATATEQKLPLLFNQPAVLMGLFYGYLPFVVLPLYSNLEKLDWSLLEAASDLGASNFQRTVRVLLPLSLPGIVAASIIVFIPSLGAYVTPDLMGGGKVALLGNLLQQQFMTARDWPFGSAIGFIMMALMLLAIMIYFRVANQNQMMQE